MRTVLERATDGELTSEIVQVATEEGIAPETLRQRLVAGEAVIFRGRGRLVGIGTGLRTKVNVNLGTSTGGGDQVSEVEKARTAERYGADTIADLSLDGDVDTIRRNVLAGVSIPVSTLPVYQCAADHRSIRKVTVDDMLAAVEKQARDGVAGLIMHAAVTRAMLQTLRSQRRILGMVSKGGSMMSLWMLSHDQENPLLTSMDRILEILHEHDVVLSLGNALRSGCTHDPVDLPAEEEFRLNVELCQRANAAGVQAIIAGLGGHIAAQDIPRHVRTWKERGNGRPLFVSGPMPIEVSVGYDHIAAAVGASLAAGAGADYLCSITPAEHIGLPDLDQMKEGLIAYRIAAHIGDTMKYGLQDKDRNLSAARRVRDWDGQFRWALEPERARAIAPTTTSQPCDMCGRHCPMVTMESFLLDDDLRGYLDLISHGEPEPPRTARLLTHAAGGPSGR